MDGKFALHRALWLGKDIEVSPGDDNLNELDHRGNTPLHIASHFGDVGAVRKLLAAGAVPMESLAGWKPLDEAIASGAREVAALLLKEDIKMRRSEFLNVWPQRQKELEQAIDCQWEMHWTFDVLHLPFIGSLVPNDTYKVFKLGTQVRADYTLQGFRNLHVHRANMSLLLRDGHLFAINHDDRTFQDLLATEAPQLDAQVMQALDYLLAHDVCGHSPYGWKDRETCPRFRRDHGWLGHRNRQEQVGDYECDVYRTKGVQFRSIIRSDPDAKRTRIPRAGPSKRDLDRERQLYDAYFRHDTKRDGDGDGDDDDDDDGNDDNDDDDESTDEDDGSALDRRWRNGLVWPSENVHRLMRSFDGKVWVAPDFPMGLDVMRPITAAFASSMAGFQYVHHLINLPTIPSGFPLRIEVPVFFPVTAIAEIQQYEVGCHHGQDFFSVPKGYSQIDEAYLGTETREMLKAAQRK